jgi:hypothetical protein
MRAQLYGAAFTLALGVSIAGFAASAAAQQSPPPPPQLPILELHFTPTNFAQLAIWIERDTGEFLATVRLTEAVAKRGIGNRPGASQMNSGFRWPYGRREGVLPIWASRRAAAPGALQFRTVSFQDRTSEGLASRTSADHSRDDYYCLSFDSSRSRKDALDAVSCASVFSSDKGRFLTEQDIERGYWEPYEIPGTRQQIVRPLPLHSLYPPRRDVTPCTPSDSCFDHPDVGLFAAHAREVMPEIDAITMATPVGGVAQHILFMAGEDWDPGDYRACVEINVEGDYNESFNGELFPTPCWDAKRIVNGMLNPGQLASCTGTATWDSWAMTFGYPYRGQPSVLYCADFRIGDETEQSFEVFEPEGSAGNWNYNEAGYGEVRPMEGMTNDPVASPGSGADRLLLMEDGYRVKVVVKPPLSCKEDMPPSAVSDLAVSKHHDERNAHQWAHLRFRAAGDDRGVYRYEVRFATEPITDEASFMAATPAKQATIEAAELLVPTGAPPGEMIEVDMGGLVQSTHYYVAVRAMDACTGTSPITAAELTTPTRVFATVTPCFVATAAWGSPLAQDVGLLRRARDRYLMSNGLGRSLVSAYYAAGPALADAIREREGLRTAARIALRPAVELARWLDRR